jgi:hypothetical protein
VVLVLLVFQMAKWTYDVISVEMLMTSYWVIYMVMTSLPILVFQFSCSDSGGKRFHNFLEINVWAANGS